LVEFCITLAVLALVGSLTVPAVARSMARQRVVAAAYHLAADIAQARQEASSRGLPMHLQTQTGADWCWAVTTQAECGCAGPSVCRLKTILSTDYPGVTLSAARSMRLEPDGTVNHSVAATLHAGAERVQVEVGPMGRARLCDPQGQIQGLKRC
jgi:Tfp pilus assembly protein FimT